MTKISYTKPAIRANAYLENLAPEARALIDGGSPLDRPIMLTMFPTQGARRKRDAKLSIRQLATKIRNTEADDKADLPWLKGARFGDQRTPLRPKGDGTMTGNSLRHDANVIAVTAVELDYDAGGMSPEEARDRLKRKGITALVYTTPSHTPAAPRWRVLAPCSSALPPERRAALVARLNGVLDGDVDGASFTLSQSYYFGNVKGRPRVKAFPVEGHRYVDQAADLDATAVGKRQRLRTNDNSPTGGAFDEAGLLADIVSGANYHGSAMSLIGHWAAAGASYLECRARIYDAFLSIPEDDRRDVWSERVATIPEMLAYVFGRQIAETYESRDRLLSLFEDLPDEDEQAAPAGDELEMLTPDECAVAASTPYVVKGLIEERNVACIVGAPGVGKSVLVPRLAYAVAQGEPIFGMRVRQGKVFYVAAENERDMKRRVRALRDRHGSADDFRLILNGGGNMKRGNIFLKRLRAAVQKERPALIVIDTLAAAMPGFEENSSEGMGAAIDVARSLTKWGAAVIVVHHDTKAGDGLPRGHGSLHGIVDVNLALRRDDDGNVHGKCSKNRNGESHVEILAYRNEVVVLGLDEDGDEERTVICSEIDSSTARTVNDRLTPSAKAAARILSDLIETEGVEIGDRKGVTKDRWRAVCIDSGEMATSDNRRSHEQAFGRALRLLASIRRVEFIEGHYAPTMIRTPTQFDDIDEQGEDE